MRPRSLRSNITLLGFGAAALCAAHLALAPNAAAAQRFHLEEATIGDVHRAIRAKEITAEQLVRLYFKRIAAYNGTCVKGEVDPATGLMFGEITPVENAGQVNAYLTLNIRGKRSKTDPADNDPKMLDALETARAQDEYFARTGNFVGPLHGIPVAIKDNYDTVDMRTTAGAIADYANDKAAEGCHHGGKAARGRRDHPRQDQSRRICAGGHRPQHARRPDLQSL